MYIVKNTGTMVIGFPENLKKQALEAAADNVSFSSLSEQGSDEEDGAAEESKTGAEPAKKKQKTHKF